jgi:hypothetical protein
MYSLIITAKMNDIDPQAWPADVLARFAEHPHSPDRRIASLELEASFRIPSRYPRGLINTVTCEKRVPSPNRYERGTLSLFLLVQNTTIA